MAGNTSHTDTVNNYYSLYRYYVCATIVPLKDVETVKFTHLAMIHKTQVLAEIINSRFQKGLSQYQ